MERHVSVYALAFNRISDLIALTSDTLVTDERTDASFSVSDRLSAESLILRPVATFDCTDIANPTEHTVQLDVDHMTYEAYSFHESGVTFVPKTTTTPIYRMEFNTADGYITYFCRCKGAMDVSVYAYVGGSWTLISTHAATKVGDVYTKAVSLATVGTKYAIDFKPAFYTDGTNYAAPIVVLDRLYAGKVVYLNDMLDMTYTSENDILTVSVNKGSFVVKNNLTTQLERGMRLCMWVENASKSQYYFYSVAYTMNNYLLGIAYVHEITERANARELMIEIRSAAEYLRNPIMVKGVHANTQNLETGTKQVSAIIAAAPSNVAVNTSGTIFGAGIVGKCTYDIDPCDYIAVTSINATSTTSVFHVSLIDDKFANVNLRKGLRTNIYGNQMYYTNVYDEYIDIPLSSEQYVSEPRITFKRKPKNVNVQDYHSAPNYDTSNTYTLTSDGYGDINFDSQLVSPAANNKDYIAKAILGVAEFDYTIGVDYWDERPLPSLSIFGSTQMFIIPIYDANTNTNRTFKGFIDKAIVSYNGALKTTYTFKCKELL